MTDDIASCRDAIVQTFPDLRNAAFRPLTMGWHSLAIDVDNRLIFKFPKGDEAARALRREARILAAARPHLAMPVPDLVLVDGPVLFSRHTKIHGDHLVSAQYEALPAVARERLADDLALFYRQVHALDPGVMRDAGAAAIQPWRPLGEIRSTALPLVPPPLRALCEKTIDAYETLGPDPLGTTYGFFDGHGWNMAFDHAQGRLNGVYDFADSGFGPLHQDFVYSAFISPRLTRLIVDRYAVLAGQLIDRRRVDILIGIHRLSELAELAADPRHLEMARDSVAFWAAHRSALA